MSVEVEASVVERTVVPEGVVSDTVGDVGDVVDDDGCDDDVDVVVDIRGVVGNSDVTVDSDGDVVEDIVVTV